MYVRCMAPGRVFHTHEAGLKCHSVLLCCRKCFAGQRVVLQQTAQFGPPTEVSMTVHQHATVECAVSTSQTKQRITLTGGGDSSVATNGGSVLTRRTSSTSSVPDKQQRQPASAGGTPSAAALPAAFPYGLQLQENGALPPQPSKRSASPNGSGVPCHACYLACRLHCMPCNSCRAHSSRLQWPKKQQSLARPQAHSATAP